MLTAKAVADAIERARAEDRVIEVVDKADQKRSGLRVRCSPGGTATATVVFWTGGKMLRRSIGPWSVVPSVAAARKQAARIRWECLSGRDPVKLRREERAARSAAKAASKPTSGPNLHDLLRRYEEARAGKLPKHWNGTSRRLTLILGGSLMRRPVADLTPADLQTAFDAWRSPATAANTLASLRPVLKWASRPARAVPCGAGVDRAAHRWQAEVPRAGAEHRRTRPADPCPTRRQ